MHLVKKYGKRGRQGRRAGSEGEGKRVRVGVRRRGRGREYHALLRQAPSSANQFLP